MASRPVASALFALLSALILSSASAVVPPSVLAHRLGFPGSTPVRPNSLCPARHAAICNTVAARLPVVTEATLVPALLEGARTRAVRANATLTYLLGDASVDEMTHACYQVCQQSFDQMTGSLGAALAAVKTGDRATAKSNVDAATDAPTTCTDCFDEDSEAVPAAITGTVRHLRKWMNNIEAISLTLILHDAQPIS